MTPDEWAWLESLPRRTLAERIAYWDARHALEEAEPRSRRVRAYAPLTTSLPSGIMEVQQREGKHRK